VNALHGCPNDGQATAFRGERINLISALPNIAKKTFNGIGTANVAMHHWWKRIKRQQMLFIFH
jgi:hypothetical protein